MAANQFFGNPGDTAKALGIGALLGAGLGFVAGVALFALLRLYTPAKRGI